MSVQAWNTTVMNDLAKTSSANGLRIACVLAAVTCMVVAVGCTREHYRRQADREVYALVDCASTDPRWPMDDYTIQPDPASRFYDPNNPNCPPMPPDDSTSHRYMECVDCKKGWPHWHDHGNTPHVENPSWMSYLPMDEDGVVFLDRDGVVQAARLHSRDYQKALEDLYGSALSVTFQRYRFDSQFFGGNSTFYDTSGRLRGGRSDLSSDTSLVVNKLLAPGTDLAVGMANSLMWKFAGADTLDANTLLDFSILQPLLRTAGREVVLENLTAYERALLAEIRDFERFRSEFHIGVIGGSRGFPSGGYWGLLRSQVEISNQISNVAALQDSLDRLEAGYESGKESLLSVEETRQDLYAGQSRLLSLKAQYENTLELFLMALGLPPNLEMRFDDNSLDRFKLIDPEITETRNKLEVALGPLRDRDIVELPDDFRDQSSAIRAECEPLLEMVERDLRILLDVLPQRSKDLELLSSREEFERGEVDSRVGDVADLNRRVVERFADFYGPEFPVVNDLVGRLLKTDDSQTWFEDYKKRQTDKIGLGAELVRTTLEIESFEKDPEAFTASVNAIALQEQKASRPAVDVQLPDDERQELDGTDEAEIKTPKEVLADLAGLLSSQLLEMSLVQAQARLDAVTLVPVELAPQEAFEVARTHRRDWMNARADLVDSWRQVEVVANALESDVDVKVAGSLDTVGNNPINFRSTTGQLSVGLVFDAPLSRMLERNGYRETLIDYQQARRKFYAFEDGIDQSLRNIIRTIRLNQLDFEITRQSVFIAAKRVDKARIDLEAPTTGTRGTSGTRDLLTGLNSLLTAQNRFLRAWVDYEVLRMDLDLDLGTMELDDRGMWIDPGAITGDTIGTEDPRVIPLPPEEIPPGTEVTPPKPESVQSRPLGPPLPLLATTVPDSEAQHAAYVERAPDPPEVRSISLPTVR